ncbi:hypothetical protein [uncultured Sunxiuqinia sp.]|uniref:hypothetical protein n=1 Tax=uncultured Sunxiuqinia sp. TaxID=1573825 RepID=UPI002AA6F7F3|nr:hypothetical protein [uncultured Sunxiuqinia sp.]
MSDRLEEIFRENREAFEDDAPQGHFDRFEAKLDHEFRHQKKWNRKLFLQIAAAVIFALLLGNQLRLYFTPEQNQEATLASVSKEYGEVEFYYTSSIDQSLNKWDKLNQEGFISEADQQMMENEIQEFDQVQNQLQKELKANPDDERVINAMLEYYQAKFSVIKIIITKLEEVKQQKLTHNETEI